MLGKLAVALLIAASPAFAQEPPPPESADDGAVAESPAAEPVAYKTKRVCRSIEVVGSSIPKTTCTTKKVPIKPKSAEAANDGKADGEPQSQL